MRLVIVESPYRGDDYKDLERNKLYLRACIRDCINRGESPYASHRMLTDALDDTNPVERALGIKAGLAWRRAMWIDDSENVVHIAGPRARPLHRVPPVFYIDFGWTDGMLLGKKRCDDEGTLYEERKLPADDPFFSEKPEMKMISVRFSAESLARADRIAEVLSRLSMKCVTRADAIRLAVDHGMFTLEESLK